MCLLACGWTGADRSDPKLHHVLVLLQPVDELSGIDCHPLEIARALPKLRSFNAVSPFIYFSGTCVSCVPAPATSLHKIHEMSNHHAMLGQTPCRWSSWWSKEFMVSMRRRHTAARVIVCAGSVGCQAQTGLGALTHPWRSS